MIIPFLLTSIVIILFIWLGTSFFVLQQASKKIYNKTPSHHSYPLSKTNYTQSFMKLMDGTGIDFWHTINSESKNVYVYLHGNAGRVQHLYHELTEYGTVVAPAYPGYHFSEGKPSEKNIYATAQVSMDFVKSLGYNEEQVIIIGHSFGSAPAVYLAQIYPKAKRLIIINGISSIYSMCRRQYGPFCELGKTLYFSTRYAQSVKIPTTIAHLKSDKRIPFEEGQKLFQAIGTKEKEFIELSDNTHAYPNLKELKQVLNALNEVNDKKRNL